MHFLIPFRIFAKKNLGHIGTFSDFEAERAKNDAQQSKTYLRYRRTRLDWPESGMVG